MNKMAVALAADSAITFGREPQQKIYNTGNKLFMLSKYHPVGIMVYGNAESMGVPWETIVKHYRAALGKVDFDSLGDYVTHLVSFLEGHDHCLWDRPVQDAFFTAFIQGYFLFVRSEIDDEVHTALRQSPSIEVSRVAQIADDLIAKEFHSWEAASQLPNFPAWFPRRIGVTRGSEIRALLTQTFQKLPLSAKSVRSLARIATMLPCREIFSDGMSGIVIAGFGRKEVFPSIHRFECEGVFSGKLKYSVQAPVTTDRSNDAIIVPFAQREMVDNFIQGIDPQYQAALEGYIQELLSGYPETVVGAIPELAGARRDEVTAQLVNASDRILKDFSVKMKAYRSEKHVDPIIRALAVLPKDELAAMAESLVNVTSFKRRVSLQAETVGGPIDVAVISKGDGFIWIKRKHYFDRDLNQSFFANYYREES
jgi:hypothetical protein